MQTTSDHQYNDSEIEDSDITIKELDQKDSVDNIMGQIEISK